MEYPQVEAMPHRCDILEKNIGRRIFSGRIFGYWVRLMSANISRKSAPAFAP